MSYEHVLLQVVEVAPGFGPRWDAFKLEWEEEEYLPLYLAMGELAEYLVESYASGSTGELAAVFQVVERHLQAGDSELENLVVVGLFEVVQNLGSQRPFGYSVFEEWLGPTGLLKWHEIDQYMDGVAEWAAEQESQKHGSAESEVDLKSISNPALRSLIARDRRKRS